jgi:outer membrane protein, heavy metal efflux system
MKAGTRKILFALFMLVMVDPLHAQDSLFTIEQVISKAEKNYPGLQLYQARIKAREELAKGAKSWMPPTVSVGLDRFPYSRSGGMSSGMEEAPAEREAGIMLSAEQMIPNPSKLDAKQQYQSSLAGIEQNNQAWTKLQVVKEIRVLYYQRYIAEQKIKLVDEADRLLELLINTAEGAYTYNQSSLSTVFKAKARREELKNMKLMLEADIAESNIGLNILMGREPNASFRIDTLITLPAYTNIPDSASLLKRSDIAAMESTIQSMELNKKLMGSASRPDFGVRVTHMQMLDMPSTWSVMGMITIPIVPWSSGMYRSEVASMNYEIEAMRQEKNTMLLMINRMSAEKLVMLNNGKKQLENYTTSIVPAYAKNFETALAGYKQNTADFFILLDAWEMLLMKKMERADKENEVLRLSAEYEFELGIIK